jgi:hypothetical protein
MNGTELAEAAHQLHPEIKVLFTTGYASETTRHERGLHERARWLLKPYSHRELAPELKALLAPAPHWTRTVGQSTRSIRVVSAEP